MSCSTQGLLSQDLKRSLLFHEPVASCEEEGGAEPPAKRARSSAAPPLGATGSSCQDCGRRGPSFRDDTDDKCYCSDCWLAFYGQLPPGATPSLAAAKAAAGSKSGGAGAGVFAASGGGCKPQVKEEPAAPGVSQALLPEDAPKGHVAHAVCKYGGAAACPVVRFILKVHGHEMGFQTTIIACGGSRHAAEVICRNCYLKFEAGWTKDQVLKFRAECYARLRGGKPWAGRAPKQSAKIQPWPEAIRASKQSSQASPRTEASRCSQQIAPPPPRAASLGLTAVSSSQAAAFAAERRSVVGGQGQTPSGCGLAAAKRAAPLLVRSAPFAGPAGSAAAAAAGWVPSGYLRCLLDDPSTAPPAPANEPRQEARSRSPARQSAAEASQASSIHAGGEQPASAAAASSAAGLRMGCTAVPNGLRLSGAARSAGGLVHRSRASVGSPGPTDSPTPPMPPPAQQGCDAEPRRRTEWEPWSSSSSQLRTSSGRDLERQRPSGGLMPLPQLRPDSGNHEDEEECSQPTPQLIQQKVLLLGARRANTEAFDPTPQLDEPTPCLSLPTPFMTSPQPLLVPPKLPQKRPEQAQPSEQPAESPERPTPCLFLGSLMA